ncbi:MAG: DUF5615 family PIN-like protein [Deltaproteobacteria bacterium]|nr:DUF5615 family PIN-like protein [Deltaproteobacteria bacterium]
MRFLLDENIPLRSLKTLRLHGHDVLAAADESPGASDETVVMAAVAEERVIVTFDRDFGTLLFRESGPRPVGVVYFRLVPRTPQEPAEILLEVLAENLVKLEGNFTVVTRNRIRQRPLPGKK